ISGKICQMAGPASRVLQLLSLLQTHKFWPGTELAQHLEVSPRTVRRDIDRLRALGYPVDATPGVAGGYQLAAGAHLPPLPPDALAVLAQACRDHEQVRFDYQARDGGESRRLVEPHQLVSAGRRWYLVAWDTRREDWRTFRIDRLRDARLAGVRFKERKLPAADAAAFV